MPRGKRIDEAWLRERYPRMTDVNELLDDCEREFGWRPSKQAVYVKANRMGLRKEPVAGRADRAERTCAVCGARFAPDEAHIAIGNTRIRTCPACLAAGRKASRWTRRGESKVVDETLKPCPCCGAPAEMRHSRAGDDFVKCTNPTCGIRTKNCHENEAGARLVWNARIGERDAE